MAFNKYFHWNYKNENCCHTINFFSSVTILWSVWMLHCSFVFISYIKHLCDLLLCYKNSPNLSRKSPKAMELLRQWNYNIICDFHVSIKGKNISYININVFFQYSSLDWNYILNICLILGSNKQIEVITRTWW